MHNKTKVLNPPSVSRKGKKRLILDLRYVNNHLFKNKIKFDDWNSFQNYLEGNKGYLFKFDLKSGYHHVDIFEEHQTYLGFSWEINQQTHYFVFNVLPFGLSTAPFVFTKVVRPLIKYWRLHAIRVVCFLDDSLGIEFGYSKSETSSKFVLNTLINAGFVINKEKSVWEPTKTLTWLGISVNLNKGCLYVSNERISNLLETVKYITNHLYGSARTLAKLAGKIISTKFVLGDITQLKTRFIYQCIESRVSWDKKFNINNYNKMVEEILFWKFNIRKLNNKSLYGHEIPHLFIYSDASNTGLASVYKENGKLNMCKKNFRGFYNPSRRKPYHFVSIKLTVNQEELPSHQKLSFCDKVLSQNSRPPRPLQ